MSIAIIGGHDCMVRRYKEVCKGYKCKVKIFTQPQGLKDQLGSPDLVIFFTNTVSHKMIHIANSVLSNENVTIVRSHTSSLSALKDILNKNTVLA